MIQKNFWVISSYKTQTYPFFYFSQETNIDLFRGILFRQVKTIRCSEAVYNERENKPVTLSCIPSSLQLQQKNKKPTKKKHSALR